MRSWAGRKKLSTTVRSVVTEIANETPSKVFVCEEDLRSLDCNEVTVKVSNIHSVQAVETFIHCLNKYCSRRILQPSEGKIVHCDRCGYTMRSTVLCKSNESEMREFHSLSPRTSKKIRAKIQASFRNVLSAISLKQRTIIRRIFESRMKIPYRRINSARRMRNIAVQCAPQQCSVLLTTISVVNVLIRLSW